MRRALLILILLAALSAVGAAVWRSLHRAEDDAASGGGRRRADTGPVPVVLAVAKIQDFPVYLDGIGTVQAFNSVTIRARVDGELQSVAFAEGQEVRKGDLLATIDPRPYKAALDQALAKKAQDEAQLNNAKSVLLRDTTLLQQRVLDRQSYDTQKFLVDQLAAAVAADQAAIESAQTQLGYTQITAPIDGRAGVRLVDAGNLVQASGSTGLVLINQVQPISVSFTLPERDLALVKAHLGAEPLKVIAFDRSNSSPLATGELAVVDNQIDQQTGTVRLKATFKNESLGLWPGQFVNARLLVTTIRGGVVVPAAAIQQGPQGPFVYTVGSDNIAHMRPITAGSTEGGLTLVESGIQSGERVVIDGQYKLQQGSPVEEAGASPAPKRDSTRKAG